MDQGILQRENNGMSLEDEKVTASLTQGEKRGGSCLTIYVQVLPTKMLLDVNQLSGKTG